MTRRSPGRSRPERRERGSTTLEFAMLSVVFLLLVFLIVQAALFYHARNVIKAEAEGTARAVRAYPATATQALRDKVPPAAKVQALADIEARKQWRILDHEGDTTSEPRVEAVVVGYDQVRVTISANPIMIIPGLFGGSSLTITETAGGPFEIFKRSGED